MRIRNYLQFIFRLASGQISEIVPEFRIGFVDRFGSADRDGPVAVSAATAAAMAIRWSLWLLTVAP